MAERVKECSKNSEFRFLPFLVSSVSAAFRPFRCHFVKSHQSHSPLCSFFNLQKHTRKKNENQLDIIFRTPQKSRLFYLVRDIVSTFAATFMNQMNKKYERSKS